MASALQVGFVQNDSHINVFAGLAWETNEEVGRRNKLGGPLGESPGGPLGVSPGVSPEGMCWGDPLGGDLPGG